MDPKVVNRNLLSRVVGFTLLAGLGACSSKPAAPAKPAPVVTPGEAGADLLPPPTGRARDLPDANVPSPNYPVPPPPTPEVTPSPLPVPSPAPETPPPPAPPAAPKTFGVWIDGAGLEAMTALGFLQELERMGHKPAKVVGTGFGCWVALSWALENTGNRAEWQAYKWTSWDSLPRGGLLGKFTRGGSRKDFAESVERLLPARRFENLALPADCPLLPASRRGARLVSARSMDLGDVLWHQFQVPALGVAKPSGDYYSGLVAGAPLPDELDSFSQDLARDKNFSGWIVVRTRNSAERGGGDAWSTVLADRADQASATVGRMGDGSLWILVDLSSPDAAPAETQNFDKRREWLLEGRRAGNNLAGRSDVKGFFE